MVVHWRSMDDMVSDGLHDFLFGGPTARQPSTLQPINTISTLVGAICCLTAGESVHAGSCPAPGQGDTHGDVRTNRHTPKHTLARCNSSKTLRAKPPPPHTHTHHHHPHPLYSASDDSGPSEGQQMYLQAKRPCWRVFKHLWTFTAFAVNALHHLFRKDKIGEMTTVVISRAGHNCAVLKLQQ